MLRFLIPLTATLLICVDTIVAQQPRTLTLTKELVLDAEKEDFSRINWVTVERSGNLVMLAPKGDDRLRFYTAAGKLTSTFLRPGEGPFELRAQPSWGWVGDTLWLVDPSNRKMVFVGPDHKGLRNAIAPAELLPVAGSKTPYVTLSRAPVAIYSNGDMLITAGRGLSAIVVVSGRSGNPGPPPLDTMIRFGRDGVLKKRIATLPLLTPQSCQHMYNGPTVSMQMSVPFCAQSFVQVTKSGQRIAILTQDPTALPGRKTSYRIVVLGEQGDTVLARNYEYTPLAVTRQDHDSVIAAREAAAKARSTPALQTSLGAAKEMTFPKAHPPVQGFKLGEDGTMWLRPGTDASPPASGDRWIVLDPKGNPLGSVVLPPKSTIHYASATTLIVTELDADDLPSVVRYRVGQ